MSRFATLGLRTSPWWLGALLLSPCLASASTPWESFERPTAGNAESIGEYSNGCLLGGSALPHAGPGYQVVRLERRRNFGHPELVDYLKRLGKRVANRNIGTMLVADMAMPRGGRFSRGHRSHQSGLDADIWLRLDVPQLPPDQRWGYSDVPAELYVDRKTWVATDNFRWAQAELIRLAAIDDRVARIFVNPALKKNLCQRRWSEDRSWLRKVRPWWGHDAHFHVRLRCPDGDDCKDQREPPEGEGCDAEVDEWLADFRRPREPAPPRQTPATPAPTPPPPQRCQIILDIDKG